MIGTNALAIYDREMQTIGALFYLILPEQVSVKVVRTNQLCADHVINLTVQTAWHKVIASWWFWEVGKRRDGLLIVTIIMTRIIMITTERDDDHVLC